MRIGCYTLLICILLSACTQGKHTENEWTDLLANGTEAWHTYGKDSVGQAWRTENGILHFDPQADSTQRGDLITNAEFANFHLSLEWKISPNGNSGIIFLVQEDLNKYAQPYMTGPEMQILDNEGHEDGAIHTHRAGDLYDLIASTPETVKAVGEWNKAEIIVNNGQLQFFLNDVKVVETTMWNEKWSEMLAQSKFKSMPDFGRYKKGKIALQDHNDAVSFRNIRIKKL